MKAGRPRSVEETLKRTISQIIRRKLTIDNTDLLSVNHVNLRGDGKKADVLVSHIKNDQQERAIKNLQSHETTIRRRVMEALPLKRIPELVFKEDPVAEQANRVEEILRDWEEKRQGRADGS